MAISTDDVTVTRTARGGRYSYAFPDGEEAELTFREPRPGVISIDHTFTPPRHRGQGVAAVLVERAVADARDEGTKIVPACSYAQEQFALHPEWQDLLAR